MPIKRQGNGLYEPRRALEELMISVKEALDILSANMPTLGLEIIPIEKAFGRTLAEDIKATINMPSFQTSNMDGYALATCKKGNELRLIGESAAGHPFRKPVNRNEAVKISTGAIVPDGADRVVMKENAVQINGHITVNVTPNLHDHIRNIGTDFAKGDTLLTSGTKLNAPSLSLCAAIGLKQVNVIRKPKIALLSTGDELQPIGVSLKDGNVYDANIIGVKALIENWGFPVTVFNRIKDRSSDIRDIIQALADFDIIVPIGGASKGEHDLMRPSFKASGFKIYFEQVALRPGKPSWFGKRDTQIVIGLPGNPASAFVVAQLFLRRLLQIDLPVISAFLTESLAENGPRESYLRASSKIVDGKIHVTPFPDQESYRLRPQAGADGLIRIPPLGGPYSPGDDVYLLPLNGLLRHD